jgi:Family of unknown function (DUF6600)
MRATLLARSLLSAAILTAPISLLATATPAMAQPRITIGFNYFYNTLAPYGTWLRSPRWGDVWHPSNVPRDFHPYTRGRWLYTLDYGWLWQSDFPWGDIAFHYGRWVYDPSAGWLWVPGYVWAPSWVVWREGNGYIGWFPMPPDEHFLAGNEVYRANWDWNGGFGYSAWYGPRFAVSRLARFWVFVNDRNFTDRDVWRHQVSHRDYGNIINRTRNVTNYETANNHIVNRSINLRNIERATGHPIQAVSARQALKSLAPITALNLGRQIQAREYRMHGGNPHASARAPLSRLPRTAANVPTHAHERAEQRHQQFNRNRGPNAQQGQAQNHQNAQQRAQAQQAQRQTRALAHQPRQPASQQRQVAQEHARQARRQAEQPQARPEPQLQANAAPPPRANAQHAQARGNKDRRNNTAAERRRGERQANNGR